MKTAAGAEIKKKPFSKRLKEDLARNKVKYMLMIPIIIYFVLFHYKPMYGVLMAFQRYRPTLGIAGSRWVGLDNFIDFFGDPYFWRLLRNTFSISFYSILFGFPAPIILALMFNEVRNERFKKTIQTVSYMPHFISLVIVCGIIKIFVQTDGIFPVFIENIFGIPASNWLTNSGYFYPIYVISGIWQEVGWGSIIYLAALSGIDQELYEAAKIDGAGRLQQIWHITLPGILPTIMILLILRIGGILSVGYEKILLLYTPTTYEVADVISTYSYRRGIIDADYSYSTAVGLFNSVVNIVFLVATNKLSKKFTEVGLF
ncbi:MAG: ABC transporter permease [Candidatus Merdivicinus sp.]